MQKIAISCLAIEVALENRYHLAGTERAAEQHILVKCCKWSHFGVISNFKVANRSFTHLAMDLDICKSKKILRT